jgi:hypothetical protein
MKHWSVVYHSQDIYGTVAELVMDDRPAWAMFLANGAETLDAWTGHKWCGPPEWTWGFVLRDAKDADDLPTSLGSVLYRSFQAIVKLPDTLARNPKRMPLTRDWLIANGIPEDMDALIAERYGEDEG